MGERLALVVATGSYDDPGLSRLRSPVHDAAAFAEVLADPEIGGFAVTSVVDQPHHKVRLAIEDFLDDRSTDDLVLLYLSCHGVKDARGRLFFAAADTRKSRLASTGVESAWLLEQLDDCRARRQVLILDCCYSGAFADRAKGAAGPVVDDHLLGAGRGRVVLTASRAGEYSFEGEPLAVTGSVFTAGLVDGLRSGAADLDHDGRITVDEAYDHAFGYVRRSGFAQTPQRWIRGGEGRIVLALNRAKAERPTEPPQAPAAPKTSEAPAALPTFPGVDEDELREPAIVGNGVAAAVAAASVVAGIWVAAVLGFVGVALSSAVYLRVKARRTVWRVCLLLSCGLIGGGLGMGVMGMVTGEVIWVTLGVVSWILAAAPVAWHELRTHGMH